jgi:hypothetical protein
MATYPSDDFAESRAKSPMVRGRLIGHILGAFGSFLQRPADTDGEQENTPALDAKDETGRRR